MPPFLSRSASFRFLRPGNNAAGKANNSRIITENRGSGQEEADELAEALGGKAQKRRRVEAAPVAEAAAAVEAVAALPAQDHDIGTREPGRRREDGLDAVGHEEDRNNSCDRKQKEVGGFDNEKSVDAGGSGGREGDGGRGGVGVGIGGGGGVRDEEDGNPLYKLPHGPGEKPSWPTDSHIELLREVSVQLLTRSKAA